MRDYRRAEILNIGLACVTVLVLLLVAAVFIYKRCNRSGQSSSGDDLKGTNVKSERMLEVVEIRSQQT